MPIRTRRSFADGYELEAVRAAERSGSVARTTRDLSIDAGLLPRGERGLAGYGHHASTGIGCPHDEELARLKREHERLQQGDDIIE